MPGNKEGRVIVYFSRRATLVVPMSALTHSSTINPSKGPIMTPIIFKTTFDFDTVWAQNRRLHKKRQLIFTLIAAGLFTLTLGEVIWFGVRYRYIDSRLVLCVLGSALLVLFYAVIHPAIVKRRVQKVIETSGVSVQTAVLYEDHMTVHAEGPKGVSDEVLQYSSFSGIWETPEMFLFMNQRSSVGAVDKRSVSEEECQRARALLRGLFPDKQYKVIS